MDSAGRRPSCVTSFMTIGVEEPPHLSAGTEERRET
jgi:hypothetical protein